MNEIQLSNDLNVITAEINSYKQVAGQAIFEIGRRLKHVKENDLAHGQWIKWLETINMDRSEAHRYIQVTERLGSENVETFQHLGLTALNLIATMPKEEREKEHTLKSGETKTVDEMTVRELREVKAKLKEVEEAKAQAERQIEALKKSEQAAIERMEELEERKPEVIKEEVVKEIVPDHVKKRIKELEAKAGELEKYRSEINDYQKKKAEIENELAELNARAREIEKSNNALAMQAKLVNAISLPVSHLEKKKAEIEQELKRNDVTKLTDHAKNTLQLKADFLMEMAVKINNFLKEESDYVEVIDVE